MKVKELREKSINELEKLLQEKRSALCQLRFSIKARQLKNHNQISQLRKEIARMTTLIKEDKQNNK